jgi:hypothetical protein
MPGNAISHRCTNAECLGPPPVQNLTLWSFVNASSKMTN